MSTFIKTFQTEMSRFVKFKMTTFPGIFQQPMCTLLVTFNMLTFLKMFDKMSFLLRSIYIVLSHHDLSKTTVTILDHFVKKLQLKKLKCLKNIFTKNFYQIKSTLSNT